MWINPKNPKQMHHFLKKQAITSHKKTYYYDGSLPYVCGLDCYSLLPNEPEQKHNIKLCHTLGYQINLGNY